MKKLYAILLGLALVLGLASIVSAYDLKVTGEFDGYLFWNESAPLFPDPYQGTAVDVAVLYVDLKGAMGDNATGELKVGLDWVDFAVDDIVPPSAGHFFFINLAKFQYNITDNFYAGVVAQQRHDGNWYRFYYSGVNGGEGFNHSIGHMFFDEFVNYFAGFKFDGGYIDVYTDLYPGDANFYVRANYASDALTANAWLANDDAGTEFVGKVAYAFTDALTLTGGIASDNGNVFLGVWAKYALEDVVTFQGYLEYDVSPFYNHDYWAMATLTMLGDFQPFLEWDEDDGISVGFDYYMGATDIWAEYWFDGGYDEDHDNFEVGVDIVF